MKRREKGGKNMISEKGGGKKYRFSRKI